MSGAPVGRDALVAALRQRSTGWVPEWLPAAGGLSAGAAEGFAALLAVLAERVAALPDRQLAALLDRLGLAPLPARAASVPVLLEPLPGAAGGRVAAGTRLGAALPGRSDPLPFETVTGIGMIAAQLAEVRSVLPGADGTADHSADALAGRPFTLFDGVRTTRRELYLAHDTLLAFSGPAVIEVHLTLATAGSRPLPLEWTWWDGSAWRPFAPWGARADASRDGTAGLTRSGTIRLVTPFGAARPTEVRGVPGYWLRARVVSPVVASPGRVLPEPVAVALSGGTASGDAGLAPDAALADGQVADVSRAFAPFGPAPAPGSVFHLACDAAFGKPGAKARVQLRRVTSAAEEADAVTAEHGEEPSRPVGEDVPQLAPPVIAWEYFDGAAWQAVAREGTPAGTALEDGVDFTVPEGWAPVSVAGDERRWLRARLVSGSYARLRVVTWTDLTETRHSLTLVEPRPPLLDQVTVGYCHTSGPSAPTHTVVLDDHIWREAPVPGRPAGPLFRPLPDTAPTVYLGFEGELPADRIGLHAALDEGGPLRRAGRLVWEGFDGTGWVRLTAEDHTSGLARTGIVHLLWPGAGGPPGVPFSVAHDLTVTLPGRGAADRFAPGDAVLVSDLRGREAAVVAAAGDRTVRLRGPLSRAYTGGELRDAPPARFGTPRTWIRARFPDDIDPPRITVTALSPNAVTARQEQTVTDEVLGSGDGTPGQVFRSRHLPVLEGVTLEVRERDGARADLELGLLERELGEAGRGGLRTVTDPRSGRVTEVWVRWKEVPSLTTAGAAERVFACDHATGRFLFGGQGHGAALPRGRDNVVLRAYRTGGGAQGNIGAGLLTQVVGAAGIAGAGNPGPAEGGADPESFPAVLARGPATLRHRRIALTEADVAAVAREVAPGIARARALAARDRHGRQLPGALRLVVIPHNGADRPAPSGELRRLVRDAVAARLPATAVPGLVVEGPAYRQVDAAVTVRPLRTAEPGPVRAAVQAALAGFLHPLTGGPQRTGWEFGQAVQVSDMARLLGSVPGVDVVTRLELLIDGSPGGDRVGVPPDAVVCAGTVVVSLTGQEG